jgi:ribosomal protein S18 acetylase RimI-like enzyme
MDQPAAASPGSYRPTIDDVPRVAGVFARAMARDPLNEAFFASCAHREQALLAMYSMIARVSVRSGILAASSPAAEGVAIWHLPGGHGFSARSMIGSGALRFLRIAGFPRAMRMGRYEGWAHELLAANTRPRSAHLVLLAVDPVHQGRGWASRLVRPVLAALDAAGTDCCLETQNPDNVPLYEHLGFLVTERTRVPGTDVGHWVMARRAATSG